MELDAGVVLGLADAAVVAAARSVLERCTIVSRDVVEESKGGYTQRLHKLLRSPPIACLVTLSATCGELRTCSMSDPVKCVTNRTVRKLPAFPDCWRFAPDGVPSAEVGRLANDIGTTAVHAWRSGKHVFVVDLPDSMQRALKLVQ